MHSLVTTALASLLVLMPLAVYGQGFTAVEVADDGAAIKMGSSLDTTLYRSSANTLRTSGRLEVAGTMDVTGATTVTGSVSVGTTLSVSGTSTLTGTVTAQNLMTSAGPFTATQSFTTSGVAYLNAGLTVTGVAEGIASPSTSGRFLHKIASCKLIFSDDTNLHYFPTALNVNDDSGFSAVPFTTHKSGPVDGWDTESPLGPGGMWRGTIGVHSLLTGSASFDTNTGSGKQNSVCMPLDGGAPGVYHVTGQVHLGGCDTDSPAPGVNTLRILSIVATYPGDPNRYILASTTVSATAGPTSLQVSDVVTLRDVGSCLFLAVRHNCRLPVALIRPEGDRYTGGQWTGTTYGIRATFALTYLGSRYIEP